VEQPPYTLAVVSHKGGTGRTTAAACLAWCFGQLGRSVTLIDADPVRSCTLLALDENDSCTWPNITFRTGLEALSQALTTELAIVDSPSLLDPLSINVLDRADGLILTSLADPLSIRTVPAAAMVIERAKVANPRLELLGLLVSIYNAQDEVQKAVLERLQQAHRELLLAPIIPLQAEFRDWPLQPGASPPDGEARAAYLSLSRNLATQLASRLPE